MDEKIILKIALISSIIGLVTLYIVSLNIEVPEKNIEKISMENIDDIVKLKGTVTKVSEYDDVTFIKLSQPKVIEIVIFKDDIESMQLIEGSEVEIFGKVDEYNGKLELIGEKVRVI